MSWLNLLHLYARIAACKLPAVKAVNAVLVAAGLNSALLRVATPLTPHVTWETLVHAAVGSAMGLKMAFQPIVVKWTILIIAYDLV